MMEATTNSKEHNDAEEMKTVPLDNHPSPVHSADPDPKTVKPGDNAEAYFENIAIDVDLNESSSGNAEENKKKSSQPGHTKSKKSVHWSEDLVMELPVLRDYDDESTNPYVNHSPAFSNNSQSFNFKDSMDTVKDVLGRWGKKVEEATREAEDLAESTWQHLKTSPSLMDAALGRIAQGTKIIAEGGYEKIFQQTFETVPDEQLMDSFACYLSTSAGPVMGIVYVSTAKLAFSSDNPLPYQADGSTEWSFYKVVIPLHQIKAVNPSTNRTNAAEKYIQVISVDNHEFWYMGFLNYSGAVKCLMETLQARDILTCCPSSSLL